MNEQTQHKPSQLFLVRLTFVTQNFQRPSENSSSVLAFPAPELVYRTTTVECFDCLSTSGATGSSGTVDVPYIKIVCNQSMQITRRCDSVTLCACEQRMLDGTSMLHQRNIIGLNTEKVSVTQNNCLCNVNVQKLVIR